MKRPFWMHQLVEYVIGVLLISQGLQSTEPTVPTLVGAGVLVNAAVARGPLAAFPKVPRAVHRIVDIVLLVATIVAASLPPSLVDRSARFVLVGVAAVLAFVAWRTEYREQPTRAQRRAAAAAARRPAPAPRTAPQAPQAPQGPQAPVRAPAIDSEQLGRAAGRTAGRLYNAARRRKRS